MKERLREARQAMAARFPLSEALWVDWISDEIDGVSGVEGGSLGAQPTWLLQEECVERGWGGAVDGRAG